MYSSSKLPQKRGAPVKVMKVFFLCTCHAVLSRASIGDARFHGPDEDGPGAEGRDGACLLYTSDAADE